MLLQFVKCLKGSSTSHHGIKSAEFVFYIVPNDVISHSFCLQPSQTREASAAAWPVKGLYLLTFLLNARYGGLEDPRYKRLIIM